MSMKFESKYKNLLWRKRIWKYSPQNVRHISKVQSAMYFVIVPMSPVFEGREGPDAWAFYILHQCYGYFILV